MAFKRKYMKQSCSTNRTLKFNLNDCSCETFTSDTQITASVLQVIATEVTLHTTYCKKSYFQILNLRWKVGEQQQNVAKTNTL